MAPETAVRAIDVMPEAERRLVLIEWNATEADYPEKRSASTNCSRLRSRRVRRPSLWCHEDQSLTYGELNARANRLAHHLRIWA